MRCLAIELIDALNNIIMITVPIIIIIILSLLMLLLLRVRRHGFELSLPRAAVSHGYHELSLTIADHLDGTIVTLGHGAGYEVCFGDGKVVACHE